jgi:thioesterase domain-containing protein
LASTIVFPGAGGGVADPAIFATDLTPAESIHAVRYPAWRRYTEDGFTAEMLIADLTEQVMECAPRGSIQIVGISIGGHFGYAVAQRLRAIGREVTGFCAIDSYMINSADLVPGWAARTFSRCWELLRTGRKGEFGRYLRLLSWRALLRLPRGRLTSLLPKSASPGSLSAVSQVDPLFEYELNMRLLIRVTAPWIASLEHVPPLPVPASLIRTAHIAGDDTAWRRRCPNLRIFAVEGDHLSLFESGQIETVRATFATAARDWHTPAGAPSQPPPSQRKGFADRAPSVSRGTDRN